MKIRLLFLNILLLVSFELIAQSTSPNPVLNQKEALRAPEARMVLDDGSSVPITFSEYPGGTTISTQYQNIGVIFESATFITGDGANPTSPVLSGTPRFQGPIVCRFVKPGTSLPAVVKSFTFDAGYFDEYGSTRIEWFDPEGKKLGQRINSVYGIETFTVEGGNIASWKISVITTEPAGFAIDNLSFVPVTSSIVFRESLSDEEAGTWGFVNDEIPGWDHVGLHNANVVYESHPPYMPGLYVSADGEETVRINQEDGVQWQFSLATFRHDARINEPSHVAEFEQVPVDDTLADAMVSAIKSVGGYEYSYINTSYPAVLSSLAPSNQKGGGNTFTCVGLVEWAAEQAGHNEGEGFVPDVIESMRVGNPLDPSAYIEVPMLSPEILYYCMQNQQMVMDPKQWITGFFDPVDFIITDPLGRRLGYTVETGHVNEIPNAYYSGNGDLEQVFIPNAIPGNYTFRFVGVGDSVFAAAGAIGSSLSLLKEMAVGEVTEKMLSVEPTPGSAGDVNGDGMINQDDITALLPRLNRFTDSMADPGDLDGDGLISGADIALLEELISLLACDLSAIKAGQNQTVYFGYAPSACATLSVSGIEEAAIGEYQYLWSTGETSPTITVCPSETTEYTLTVSKGGCSVTSEVSVCVVDVRCQHQRHGINKVMVCHNPSGKPGKEKTLCISADGVADHLLHGDQLGACGLNGGCEEEGENAMVSEKDSVKDFEATQGNTIRVSEVYPNPFNDQITLTLSSEKALKTSYVVYDEHGLIVAKGKLSLRSGENTFPIRLQHARRGIYYLKLEAGGVTIPKLFKF